MNLNEKIREVDSKKYVVKKCPGCGKIFYISAVDMDKRFQNGYVPIFCNIKCQLRFSEQR